MRNEPVSTVVPHWYQDLSIPQIENVFALGDILRADYAEQVTGRTQRALSAIGVTSTFIKISAQQIRKFRRLTDFDPTKFLLEIYRSKTGKSFVDEGYKKVYDCNERIILSAIAFLTFPEAIAELHRRIPMTETPKFPPKPTLLGNISPRKKVESPYLEQLFTRPDWLTYRKEIDTWRQQCQNTAVPCVILPPFCRQSQIHDDPSIERVDGENEVKIEYYQEGKGGGTNDNDSKQAIHSETQFVHGEKIFDKVRERIRKSNFPTYTERQTEPRLREKKILKNRSDYKYSLEAKSSHYPKNKYEYNDESNKNRSDHLECGFGDNKRSWLGEKNMHLIIAGSAVNDDSPNCPISLEAKGLAYVTPDNSDERFFAALNFDGSIGKTYPQGRENVSRNWQEWLQNVDEEYMTVEKEANKLLESVQRTLKLIEPKAACDSCCACRETRKANINYHKTKRPHMVIESIATNEKQNRYLVGALAMNSPAPSPSPSIDDLPEIVPSQDKIINNRIVSGVTNDMGHVTYHVSGMNKYVQHMPQKIVSYVMLPNPIKNVPPCNCSVGKTINKDLSTISSNDNIPWVKNQQLCVGKNYRAVTSGASSCQNDPNDKSCQRNPLKKRISELMATARRGEETYPLKNRNMFSTADFQPCGDEDGMAVCGGPWGAVNIPDAKELARRAAEKKMILESPPCGDRPGQAICGAPFPARHPIPKKTKKNVDDDDDDEEAEEEDDEEKIREQKKRDREARKMATKPKVDKIVNRDPQCSAVQDQSSTTNESGKTAQASSKQSESRQLQVRKAGKKKAFKQRGIGSKNEYDSKARTQSEGETAPSLQNFDEIQHEFREKSKDGGEHRNEKAEMIRKQGFKEIKNRWNKMKKSMNKFVEMQSLTMAEPLKMCKREVKAFCSEDLTENTRVGAESPKEGPFGWKTKSDQELPPQKTLVYLVESKKPIPSVPVKSGGKSCKCRENRNAKKILLYGVSAITEEGKNKRDEKVTKVIDGLLYITPTPSVRNSDEYIPEYDLYDSPYEKCVRKWNNDNFQYIERYLGPKSLMVRSKPRNSSLCNCSTTENNILANNAKHSRLKENAREFPIQDQGLIDFYSRCRDNVPCWLRCAEFSNDGCCTYPRRLQIKRPVCECKYERKIVKREEEKDNWLRRQARLKNHKKLPFRQVAGISRPMQMETNVVISDVKKMPREEDNVDDIEYCVSGIAQNFVMGPAERVLSRIGMHTPVSTPDEPSKEDIRTFKSHRHWSVTDIHARQGISMNTQALSARDIDGTNPKNNYRSAVETIRVATESSKSRDPNPTKDHGLRLGNSTIFPKEVKKLKKMQLPLAAFASFHRKTQSPSTQSVEVIPRVKPTTTKLLREVDKNKILARKSTEHVPPNKDDMTLDSPEKTKEISQKTNMKELLKVELEKMATEGFLFAKLPACWDFPQLQYWLMYREGIALPLEEKKKLMERSLAIWNSVEKQNPKKIKAPLFEMPESIMDNCNYDEAHTIKREVTLKKEIFLSDVRKVRVLQARNMWGLMEFGKFPGISFKEAFFTYQASKESDGFVFKPWKNE